MILPEGYEYLEIGGVRAFSVRTAVAWLRDVLAAGATLHAWAAGRAVEAPLSGRGAVYAVPAPLPGPDGHESWVVRHYYRGGAVAAPLLGDRYLAVGTPRPLRELAATHNARTRGVPAPAVVAGAVYSAGMWYRADLVTERIPDTTDLADALWGGKAEGISAEAALHATGLLVRRLEQEGILHPDLNAKNLLISESASGVRVYLLDLDGCCARDPGVPAPAFSMRGRLERSLRKFENRTGRRLSPAAWAALRSGFSSRSSRSV